MERRLYLSISKKFDGELSDFIGELHKHKVLDKYCVNIISDPVYYFRDQFVDEVVKNGLSSMLKFSMVMDDITTPSMHVDDIEIVFHKFVDTLKPVDKLVIIDPYFYPKTSEVAVTSERFIKLITPIISDLKQVIVVSNGRNKNKLVMDKYAECLRSANPNLELLNLFSMKFHDRFWINPDEKKGIVVGTSVNGIGKKISLVDTLRTADVQNILNELDVAEGLFSDLKDPIFC